MITTKPRKLNIDRMKDYVAKTTRDRYEVEVTAWEVSEMAQYGPPIPLLVDTWRKKMERKYRKSFKPRVMEIGFEEVFGPDGPKYQIWARVRHLTP